MVNCPGCGQDAGVGTPALRLAARSLHPGSGPGEPPGWVVSPPVPKAGPPRVGSVGLCCHLAADGEKAAHHPGGGRRLGPGHVAGNWDIGRMGTGPPGWRRQTSLPPTPVSLNRSALSLHTVSEEWGGSKRGNGDGEGQGPPGTPRRVSKSHSSSQSPPPTAPQAKAGRH